MNATLAAGDQVHVRAPHHAGGSEWLLPGEACFVLEIRSPEDASTVSRARVRCPATGVDCWLALSLLDLLLPGLPLPGRAGSTPTPPTSQA